MYALIDIFERIRDFMETGGPVLWVILVTSFLMWTLILERYWYIRMTHPKRFRAAKESWNKLKDTNSWYAHRIREELISRVSSELHRSLLLLKTLVALCPLMGLLGTVLGMVQVFEIMAIVGTGNARAMASGISMATIPTMAGMVTALSGFYFSSRLQYHAQSKTQIAADQLEIHDL
jgi:biopolymer transport protein ExbB